MKNQENKLHSFHIPVMGLAYTIDTPIKVAHLGISSVVSIVDDDLIEKMLAFYSTKFKRAYQPITPKTEDYRAKRITAYLDLMADLVQENLANFKKELCENKKALEQFIQMLPKNSVFKAGLLLFFKNDNENPDTLASYLDQHLIPGSIDVNIMTKIDKENVQNKAVLPVMYNDAHAALRGFAQSKLNSSVVLSAGMNPRLYSYFEQFSDFYPDRNFRLRKKIILKVSDFRSAMIQGSFLAKKGLWVSEYRIESGLNCGGHAFATDGLLLGPILEEFKQRKSELITTQFQLLIKALELKNIPVPSQVFPLEITVQGGVGTAAEHAFLLNEYQLDSVGWGSPFLLVPEATTVDAATRALLAKAEEKDLYLSHISPLGVPFNTVKGTTNEVYKQQRISKEKAGSSCPKKFLALQKDANGNAICTASKKFQEQKISDLQPEKANLTYADYQKQYARITEKSCLCVGLANASYLEHNISIKGEMQGVVICPGPNMAYFNKEISLQEMVEHIYGYQNVMPFKKRPNLFLKEIELYIDYLQKDLSDTAIVRPSLLKKWTTFHANLQEGLDYYEKLFQQNHFFEEKLGVLEQLSVSRKKLMAIEIPALEMV